MIAAFVILALIVPSLSVALGVYFGYQHGREQREELAATLNATVENFADYVEDHANTYAPTTWSEAVWPGGQVCAVQVAYKPDGICGMPVESEPCPDHTCRCARDLVGDDTFAMLTGCREGSTS